MKKPHVKLAERRGACIPRKWSLARLILSVGAGALATLIFRWQLADLSSLPRLQRRRVTSRLNDSEYT